MSKNNIVDWNVVYTQQAGLLLGVCRRYVKDTKIAEDLLHDGFIKAIEKSDSYSGNGSIEGWLRRVVVNNVLEYLRNEKKTSFTDIGNVSLADEVEVEKNATDIKSIIKNSNFSQEELLELIDQLPNHHKAVFNLHVIDNYAHKEIATLLNIEQSTSKSHLSRARKKIQQLLEEKVSEMKKGEENKRKKLLGALPLIAGSAKANSIDRLFKNAFLNYKLPTPNMPEYFKKKLSNAKPLKKTSKTTVTKSSSRLYWGGGIVGALIIGTVAYNGFFPNEIKKQKSFILPTTEKEISSKKSDQENVVTPPESKKNKDKTTKALTNEKAEAYAAIKKLPKEPVEEIEPERINKQKLSKENKQTTADTVKKEPVVVRRQVVIRKQVVLDENEQGIKK